MENAADALKIAFGIFVFVLALTLAISIIGQARATSEVVFHTNDKTEFYQYATADNIANSKNRIVGMETVIPTIHRYAKEQYAVTIFKKNGNLIEPIVRYDLWTEGFMSNWNQILKNKDKENSSEKESYEEVSDRLRTVQEQAYKALNMPMSKEFKVEEMIKKLYPVTSETNEKGITVGAPWIGDNKKVLERIKADMTGTKYTNNSITYTGKNLKQYENSKFIEKFIEVTTSGKTVTDEGDSLETIKGNKKLEIIYVIQN